MTDCSDATIFCYSAYEELSDLTATPLKSDIYMQPLYYLTIIMPVSERIWTP